METTDRQFHKQEMMSAEDQNQPALTIHDEKFGEKVDNSSLDPNDWSAFRTLAHEMIDRSISYMQGIRENSVYHIVPIPQEVCNLLNEPLPETPQGLEKVCQDFITLVLPYCKGNTHPRFWGWAAGNGNAGGIISQLMMATINSNAVGGTQSCTLVERQVLEWCRQIFNFPDSFGGLIVNGTSMATIIAMTIARNHALGKSHNVRLEGIIGGPQLVGYTSTETHFCVAKAFELLGLGRNALRLIPVNANFCIDMNQLEIVINEDLKVGNVPFCIIGNAGTLNTGSIDDLCALKDFASKYKLWLHVDGAFGALAILDSELKPRLAGIEYADSLAFDFHKWLHVPYDAGCLLIRNKMLQFQTFSSHASFLTTHDHPDCYEVYHKFGLELSRGFRALNVWFTLKEHGIQRLGQKIHENCKQAKYLASLLSQYSWIRIKTPIILNIVCFRLEPENLLDAREIDIFNNNIVTDIQKSGMAVPSIAVLDDRLYIRCCIINHRTVYNDFHIFVNELVRATEKRLSQ